MRLGLGSPDANGVIGDSILGQEIRHLFRQFDETRRWIDATHADWNPDTLRTTVAEHLPDTKIIVVSNREPYIHNWRRTATRSRRPRAVSSRRSSR